MIVAAPLGWGGGVVGVFISNPTEDIHLSDINITTKCINCIFFIKVKTDFNSL